MTQSKFALDDKDFESFKADVPGTNKTLEILKFDKDEYCVLEHVGDNVGEIATLTKKELKVLWMMLSNGQ